MKFNTIWSNIIEDKPFYLHLSILGNYKLDFERQIHYDMDSSSWSADPVLFIIQCFRKQDLATGEVVVADEYLSIKKYLKRRNVNIPFTRSEFNDYIISAARSNTVLSIFEDGIFSSDNKFVIPQKEEAKKILGLAYEYMISMSSDLFLYAGMTARCIVDIRDFISGFEVYTGRGNVFIPMFGTVGSSSYTRSAIRSIPIDSSIRIFEDSTDSFPKDSGFIAVPREAIASVTEVSKYFSSFKVDSDDFEFILGVSTEISKGRDSVNIEVNNSCTVAEYMAAAILEESEKGDNLVYSSMFRTILKMSRLTLTDKEIIVSRLIEEGKKKSLSTVIAALRASPDRLSPKIRDMVLDSHIVIVSRQPASTGTGGSIKIFNTVGKYFKDIPMESKLLAKHLVPELGGFSFIERYCDITIESIPTRFKNVESFISASIVSAVHEIYQGTHTYRETLGLGSHYVDGTPVFNAGNEVYGIADRRSINGCIFRYEDVDFQVPSTKPTVKEVSSYISKIKDVSRHIFSTIDNQSDMISILLASTLVSPYLATSSRMIINATATSPYKEAELKSKVFRGVFRVARVTNIPTTERFKNMDNEDTILTVFSVKSRDQSYFQRIVRIRAIEESVLGNDSVGRKSVANFAPFFIFTENDIEFEDSVIFKFKIREDMTHDRMIIPKDVSPFLISYVVKTANVFRRLEEDMLVIKNKKAKKMPMYLMDEYMEFFSKIVAGMILCSHTDTGYSPSEFHDIMFESVFYGRSMDERVDLKKLILEVPLSRGIVMDKIIDPEYRLDEVDDKIAFVDKLFHVRYVDSDNSRMSVVFFSRRAMYKALQGVIDMPYAEFIRRLEGTKGYLPKKAAMNSYRVGRDRAVSVMKQFIKIHGNNREDFAALRYDERTDL